MTFLRRVCTQSTATRRSGCRSLAGPERMRWAASSDVCPSGTPPQGSMTIPCRATTRQSDPAETRSATPTTSDRLTQTAEVFVLDHETANGSAYEDANRTLLQRAR